jgi:hypothetical protein
MPDPHSINDVVDSLYHALQVLGCSVDAKENDPVHDGTNIFFRAHLLPAARLAEISPGSVIYNLEQVSDQSPWIGPVYRSLLSRFSVWDYSRRNLAAISAIADRRLLHLVPLGYMPQLARIPAVPTQDIDVLFYGAVNRRRRAVLLTLQQAGLRVRIETQIRGEERDALIARSKVVLNMHYYPSAIFEIVRVSYLLANRKAVVGECGPGTEIDSDVREAIVPANYADLCDRVVELVGNDAKRFELERRGHEIFAMRRLPDTIAQAIAETDAASGEALFRPTDAASSSLASEFPKAAPAETCGDKSTVTRMAKTKRILFHAINGSGLGHVVRLSVIARTLQDHADVAFFSSSHFADQYWPGKIFTTPERLDDRFELNSEQRNRLGFLMAVNKFSPDVVVFDTHWPHTLIDKLRENNVRTVLVLRTMLVEAMERALRLAIRDFSSVLIPHHAAEVEQTYGGVPELLGLMTTAPCVCIGPVARTAANKDDKKKVIFTLGGGGEYWHRTPSRSVETFIDVYRKVAKALVENSNVEPIFAAGPLLDRTDEMLSPFRVVRSHSLHEMFGPNTIVVARGGYNTCWEAVAARAGLIIVGDIAHGVEDVATRGRFLEAEGLARAVQTDASEILNACKELLERPASLGDHYLRRAINSGLSLARDEILGLSSLGPPRPLLRQS